MYIEANASLLVDCRLLDRDSSGFGVVLIQLPAVNKACLVSLYRLRRGVMVRMRPVESPLKVQWRVVVGIEECVQQQLRILTFMCW